MSDIFVRMGNLLHALKLARARARVPSADRAEQCVEDYAGAAVGCVTSGSDSPHHEIVAGRWLVGGFQTKQCSELGLLRSRVFDAVLSIFSATTVLIFESRLY